MDIKSNGTLDSSFIKRTLYASLFLTALAWAVVAFYFGWTYATGVALGSLWSIANLVLIRFVVEHAVTPDEIHWRPVVMALLVKFPLLYVAGYFVLRPALYPVSAPLVGFLLPFGVLVLKAGGRMLMGIHGPDAGRHSSGLVPKR
jgi:hypothetical protein